MAFAASPALSMRLDPNHYRGGRLNNAMEREARNTSAAAMMLGEFRTSMSDIMYLKTERYLHGGVGYVSTGTWRFASVSAVTADLDDDDAHDSHVHHGAEHVHTADCDHDEHEGMDTCDRGTPTIIRTPENDYRGFIGDLHRKVKPWRDPSHHMPHGNSAEILPWFRVMTLANPEYVQGYTTGSWWLKNRDAQEALKFVDEGIQKNPDAFQIYLMKGQILFQQARHLAEDAIYDPPPNARTLVLKARDAYVKAAELAAEQRPQLGDEDPARPDWTHYMEEDARASFRLAALTEERYGSPTRAAVMARRALEQVPEDPTLTRISTYQDPLLKSLTSLPSVTSAH